MGAVERPGLPTPPLPPVTQLLSTPAGRYRKTSLASHTTLKPVLISGTVVIILKSCNAYRKSLYWGSERSAGRLDLTSKYMCFIAI